MSKFVAFTLTKIIHKDKTEKDFAASPIRIRYAIDKVELYHEYSKTSSVIMLKDGDRLYCKETIDELDLIFNGANEKIVGLLYGKT